MTPRQFESEYGRPVAQRVTVLVGQTAVIPADPDRYLVVFVNASGSCVLRFGEDPDLQFGGIALPAATMPLLFDFAHHGSLPGCAWTVEGVDPKSTLTYVVGRMVALSLPELVKGVSRGKSYRRPQSADVARGGRGVPPTLRGSDRPYPEQLLGDDRDGLLR